MQNIVVDRYDDSMPTWGGYVEPDDRSWIIFLDKQGKPALYWSERDENGGVIGTSVAL